MTSWWKLMAQSLGAGNARSHRRRVAEAIGADARAGRSWAQRIAGEVGTVQETGSWDRRMVDPAAAAGAGSWARRLYADFDNVFGGDEPGGGEETVTVTHISEIDITAGAASATVDLGDGGYVVLALSHSNNGSALVITSATVDGEACLIRTQTGVAAGQGTGIAHCPIAAAGEVAVTAAVAGIGSAEGKISVYLLDINAAARSVDHGSGTTTASIDIDVPAGGFVVAAGAAEEGGVHSISAAVGTDWTGEHSAFGGGDHGHKANLDADASYTITQTADTGEAANLCGISFSPTTPTDPDWNSVLFLAGFDGEVANEAPARIEITAVGGATFTETDPLAGAGSLSLNGTSQALQLSASADALLGAAHGFDMTWDATVQVAAFDTGDRQVIYSKRQAASSREFTWAIDTDQTIKVTAWSAAGAAVVDFNGTTALQAGSTYQLRLSRAAGTWHIFVDGTLENSAAQSGQPGASTSAARIGALPAGSRWFKGKIDEFKINAGKALATGDYTPVVGKFTRG